jgi:hypothetical protein
MRSFLKGALVGAAVTAAFGGGIAFAGSGVGGVFNLGQGNIVAGTTGLSGATSGAPQLSVVNTATTAGSSALSATSKSAAAAFLGVNQGGGPGLRAVGNTSVAAGQIVNSGTGPGLRIDTAAAAPPLVVSSSAKVAHLNADLLDGHHASDFSTASTTFATAFGQDPHWSTIPVSTGADSSMHPR